MVGMNELILFNRSCKFPGECAVVAYINFKCVNPMQLVVQSFTSISFDIELPRTFNISRLYKVLIVFKVTYTIELRHRVKIAFFHSRRLNIAMCIFTLHRYIFIKKKKTFANKDLNKQFA